MDLLFQTINYRRCSHTTTTHIIKLNHRKDYTFRGNHSPLNQSLKGHLNFCFLQHTFCSKPFLFIYFWYRKHLVPSLAPHQVDSNKYIHNSSNNLNFTGNTATLTAFQDKVLGSKLGGILLNSRNNKGKGFKSDIQKRSPRTNTPTQVIFLYIADISIERAMTKDDQHDHSASFQCDDVCRVPNHCILLLGFRGQQYPWLVMNMEHSQLIGHIPCWINFSPIHVNFILGKKNTNEILKNTKNIKPEKESKFKTSMSLLA